MFRLTLITCLAVAVAAIPSRGWFEHGASVYQIYPRSFKDSNGDGIGDLNGITSKLEHVADIGSTALWMSPIYPSPQVDFGYDISNFTDIDPIYGTLEDFDKLVAKAKLFGLKVIMDFVPNHSSHEHPWFKKSVQKIKPYDDYYIWHDGKMVNGVRQPPTNWLSVFQGSAWKWNEQRKQYYFHQFADGQPDLNYRNANLRKEMENVLTFWMERGVEGFRIDAINHMFEDQQLRDEPVINPNLTEDNYDRLDHIYTKNLEETYDVLKSWRELMDRYSAATKTEAKMILTEAYVPQNLISKYYEAGSDVPFNFMFISELNKKSTANEFYKLIDSYLRIIPLGKASNWVIGNHDNHRVATRFGSKRADQITMLSMVLPGISVTYNGDEIGMENRNFSYKETVDPAGCNAGPDRYSSTSRDPERTPFQWDNTTSAGFSTNPKTWLPVHGNYKTLNLAAQKEARVFHSHYKVYKAMAMLKTRPTVVVGSVQIATIYNNVFAVVRKLGYMYTVLLINFSEEEVVIDLKKSLNILSDLTVYVTSVDSKYTEGKHVDMTQVKLPGAASMVLTNSGLFMMDE